MIYDWPAFTVQRKPDTGQILAPIALGIFSTPGNTIFLITTFDGKTHFAYCLEQKQFLVTKDITAETPKPFCPRCGEKEFGVRLTDLQREGPKGQIFTCLACGLQGFIQLRSPTNSWADMRWEFEPIEYKLEREDDP